MARLKGKSEEIIGNLDPKHWVQKSDPLVMMRTVPFSLGELKLLDTYISRINAADDTRRTVIFTKEEYEELMGLSCVDYRTLQKHTKGMLGKVVELQMPNKDYLQFVLFEQAYYHKDDYGKPVIELTCTTLAKDLFFCIGKYHYFKYALGNVINLTRKASYLIYLYIFTNRYRGDWEIDLAELRDSVLDCKDQDSYKEFKIFKNRVLDPAVKEVNAKTDCHFEYKIVKRGRRVAKIRFIYHAKMLPEPTQVSGQSLEAPAIESSRDYGGELPDLLGSVACNNEFTPEQVRVLQDLVLQVIKSGDMLDMCDYLSAQVNKMNLYKPKDRFGYLRKMIESDIK